MTFREIANVARDTVWGFGVPVFYFWRAGFGDTSGRLILVA